MVTACLARDCGVTMLQLDSQSTARSPLGRLGRSLQAASETALVFFADQPSGHGPVVCAIDSTPASRSVARVAKELADDLGADLEMVHVRDDHPADWTPEASRRRRRTLERVAANARRATGDGRLTTLPADRPAANQLLSYAQDRDACLLVTGLADGATDAWLAADLELGAPCPVIVVIPAGTGGGSPR